MFIISLIVHVYVRVFEKRVLRKILRPKRDKVTGEWRQHNEEFHDLYSLPNIVQVIKSRKMRWAGAWGTIGDRKGVYTVLVGRCDGRRPLGRPRHRWEDGFSRCGMGRHGLDCSGPGQRQATGTCQCFNEPSGSIKCVKFLDWPRSW